MHIENFTTDSLYGYMESFMLNDDGPWMFLDDITLCESQISRQNENMKRTFAERTLFRLTFCGLLFLLINGFNTANMAKTWLIWAAITCAFIVVDYLKNRR